MNSMNELFNRYVSECVPELEPRTRRDYLGDRNIRMVEPLR